MGTEIYFMSAHEAEERNRTADDRNRRELFEAKCEPQGEIDMVALLELFEDMRLEGKEGWKCGWYFDDEDIGSKRPFATKEAAETRIEEWRSFLLSLYQK
jgi:hypothetical protein